MRQSFECIARSVAAGMRKLFSFSKDVENANWIGSNLAPSYRIGYSVESHKCFTDSEVFNRHVWSIVPQHSHLWVCFWCFLEEIFNTMPSFIPVADEDKTLVPAELTGECLAQTWYRLLHCLGNPVQLARPAVVSQTHKFLQYAIISAQVRFWKQTEL